MFLKQISLFQNGKNSVKTSQTFTKCKYSFGYFFKSKYSGQVPVLPLHIIFRTYSVNLSVQVSSWSSKYHGPGAVIENLIKIQFSNVPDVNQRLVELLPITFHSLLGGILTSGVLVSAALMVSDTTLVTLRICFLYNLQGIV